MSIALSSADERRQAFAAARTIALAAYALAPPIEGELERAADRGAAVTVRLEARPAHDPTGARARANAAAAERLRRHGVAVTLAGDPRAAAHAKFAIADGVLWLDDRNFPKTGPDCVVRDDEACDVAAAARCLRGEPAAATGRVAFTKADAARQERDAIASAPPSDVDVASEDIGNGPVTHALAERLARGDRVRVVVDRSEARHAAPGERAALARLARLGAEIRLAAGGVDKIAVARDRAWLGSTNATYPTPDTAQQTDWGLVTRAPDAVGALQARFDAVWTKAAPYGPEA